jgi:cobaltochelatase CobN
VLRLLGGSSYWRYGLDEALRLARINDTQLVAIAGDAIWDPVLASHGTVAEATARRLWSYFVEGGSENLANALRHCAHLIGEGAEPEEAKPLPSAGVYRGLSAGAKPSPPVKESLVPSSASTAAIIFYRALMQAGQTEPVDALCAALTDRGLRPLPIYASSLKTKDDAAFVAGVFAEQEPAIVLNATGFALSQPGRSFAGTVLDGAKRPVLQISFAGVSEEAWAASSRGLSPTDLTMNVVLPEMDGRVITRAVSFKEAGALDPLTEFRPVSHRSKPDRIAHVADLAERWVGLRNKPNQEKRVAIILSNYHPVELSKQERPHRQWRRPRRPRVHGEPAQRHACGRLPSRRRTGKQRGFDGFAFGGHSPLCSTSASLTVCRLPSAPRSTRVGALRKSIPSSTTATSSCPPTGSATS